MATKGRGRPPVWHTKITAPPEALEFYAMLAKLQKSDAFDSCHVYHGALLDGEAMVKWRGQVTKLPFVIASFMGLPHGRRQCDTVGCCNPFHFIQPGEGGGLLVHAPERGGVDNPGLDEWIDLVDFEIDKRARRIESVSFEEVRPWIPVEDLSDEQLRTALAKMKEGKGEGL